MKIDSISNIGDNYQIDIDRSLFISSIGYESRSIYLSEKIGAMAKIKMALGFSEQRVLKYHENLKWYRKNLFEVMDDLTDDQFAETVKNVMDLRGDSISRITIDISCMNRARIAWLTNYLIRTETRKIIVDFLYAPARFTPPNGAIAPNTSIGPVIGDFAGWTNNPFLPLTVIIGLGYEEGKALGAIEFLQADEPWLFVPKSLEQAYADAVADANQVLLNSVRRENVLEYDLADPVGTWVKLESLVHGVKKTSRPVLLPLGPKLFALISALVASQHTEVGLWRVRAYADAVDQFASGEMFGLSVVLG